MIFLERDKMPKRERWGRERERERELCVQLSTSQTYVTQVEREVCKFLHSKSELCVFVMNTPPNSNVASLVGFINFHTSFGLVGVMFIQPLCKKNGQSTLKTHTPFFYHL